jgi:hypothetical protein
MPPRRRAASLLLTLAGATSLAACGELASETIVLSGTYNLVEVNDRPLPSMAYNLGGVSLEIIDGFVRFDADSARGGEERHYRCPDCAFGPTDDTTPRVYAQGYRMIAGNTIVLTERLSNGTVLADTGVVVDGELLFVAKRFGTQVGSNPIRAKAVYVKQ